jgi:hypothetical protein
MAMVDCVIQMEKSMKVNGTKTWPMVKASTSMQMVVSIQETGRKINSVAMEWKTGLMVRSM